MSACGSIAHAEADDTFKNRAYAASQLADLAQKLAKAQSSITSTRASLPKLPKDEKDKVSLNTFVLYAHDQRPS